MNFLPGIKDTAENKISFLHLLLFAVALPFDRFYSQLVLISFVIHSLVHLRKSRMKGLPWKKIILLQSAYLLTLVGTIYSFYPSIAFGLWEKQLAIFLFPLLFFINSIQPGKYIPLLLNAFTVTVLLIIIFLYIDAFRIMQFYQMPLSSIWSGNFISHKFSEPLGLHATYLSIYSVVALVRIIELIISRRFSKKLLALLVFSAVIISLGLLQLSSRSALAALLVILFTVLPFVIADARKRMISLGFACAVTIVAAIVVLNTESLSHRYITEVRNDLGLEKLDYSLTDPRAARWELAAGIIKESPWIGYGTGDEVPLLKNAYYQNKMYDSYVNELNAHNQYLSFLIKGGVFALFVYVLTLCYFIRIAWKARSINFMAFLILVTVTGFTENLLNVNKGIFFYAFFLSLYASSIFQLKTGKNPLKASNPESKKPVITNEAVTA